MPVAYLLNLILGLVRRPQRLVIGPVEKQYGEFRLHRQAWSFKDGRLQTLLAYLVVLGDLTVPVSLTFGARRDDPRGYASVLRERHGPFRECVYVGDIPIKRSTEHDIYDHVDKWLHYKRTAIARFIEQLDTEVDPATGNTRRATFHRGEIAKWQEEYQIVDDAFRAFIVEFPNAAVGTRRNAALREREARRLRKAMQKAIWLTNKLIK